MKFAVSSAIILAFAPAAFAVLQFNGVTVDGPTCLTDCIGNALMNGDGVCDLADIKCYCTNTQATIPFDQCLVKSCNSDTYPTAITAMTNLCSGNGYPFNTGGDSDVISQNVIAASPTLTSAPAPSATTTSDDGFGDFSMNMSGAFTGSELINGVTVTQANSPVPTSSGNNNGAGSLAASGMMMGAVALVVAVAL